MNKLKNPGIKLLITACCIAFVAASYYLKIPCIIKYFFHIPCPACGMTRALISAVHFDFVKAFKYHPMFWSLPLLFFFFLYDMEPFKSKIINISVLVVVLAGFILNYIFLFV